MIGGRSLQSLGYLVPFVKHSLRHNFADGGMGSCES